MNNVPNEEVSSSEADTTNDTGPAWKLPSTVLRTIHLDYGVHKQFKSARKTCLTSKNYDAFTSRLLSESFNAEDDSTEKQQDDR